MNALKQGGELFLASGLFGSNNYNMDLLYLFFFLNGLLAVHFLKYTFIIHFLCYVILEEIFVGHIKMLGGPAAWSGRCPGLHLCILCIILMIRVL